MPFSLSYPNLYPHPSYFRTRECARPSDAVQFPHPLRVISIHSLGNIAELLTDRKLVFEYVEC